MTFIDMNNNHNLKPRRSYRTILVVFACLFFSSLVWEAFNERIRDAPRLRLYATRIWQADFSITMETLYPAPPPPPPPAPPPCKGCIVSEAILMGSLSPNGYFYRKRYRFNNVWLKDENTMGVYLAPEVPLPVNESLVDGVHTNGTSALPTTLWYWKRGTDEWSLKVEYTHANSTVNQPKCTRWEERPVYMFYTPHPTNIWHALNDALMAVFQTLREERLLPVAEIDDEGNMKEWTRDLQLQCPRRFFINGTSYRPKECRNPSGWVISKKCDPEKDSWCRPGLVAINRTDGPIFMLAKLSEEPQEKWKHLYDAVSENRKPVEPFIGTCFRELYVGRSNTLNMYLPMLNLTTAKFGTRHTVELRRNAMATFQRLIYTAELNKRTIRKPGAKPKFIEWDGYANPQLERLRQGIGPEDIELLEVLRNTRSELITVDPMPEEDKMEMRSRLQEETLKMRALVETMAAKRVFDRPSQIPTEVEYDHRPVVTYMWRSILRRCAINEADILEYILSRYNVTVRVTTFEEPFLEMMQLMNNTDMLLGMHGAGWTNGIFLKNGAAGLQMSPYGWGLHRKSGDFATIRGAQYKYIIQFHAGPYADWVNPYSENAFMRVDDFGEKHNPMNNITADITYQLHPHPEWPMPHTSHPGSHFIYQNTLVDMESLAPVLDGLFAKKGILPMPNH